MARPPKARAGSPVSKMHGGFPLFFKSRAQRVVTADPWAYMENLAVTKLRKNKEAIALAYIGQGREFFAAAQNPRLSTRPLLYYYAYLNLVKAYLLISGVALPAAARHGISDPRANSRQRLRFEGQRVYVNGRARDRSEIFAEFATALGYVGRLPRSFRVVDLLNLVPSVHRTFITVRRESARFVPLSKIEVLHANSELWARLHLSTRDKDVDDALGPIRNRRTFTAVLRQVQSEQEGEIWFETGSIPGQRRGFDTAIARLATQLRNLGIASILTTNGYRFYISGAGPSQHLPSLAASYAIAFYLGSITRYKPDVFDKIVSGKHSWVMAEFLATQPTQFIYSIASELAGVDVVRPYAVIANVA